jgi:hypothetical protein
MAKSTALEVKRGKMWIRLNVNDAIASGERHGRCVECQKAAKVHERSRGGGQAAHIEHFKANPKCSRSGR